MCFKILLFGFLLVMFSCHESHDSLSNKQIVDRYISALNKPDIDEISNFISDSLKVEELEFSEGRITRSQTFAYENMDFSKWEARRDTLIFWINIHHPDLNGFDITQNIQGGQNYLKAIQLYRSRY